MRSEVLLAKTELMGQVAQAKSSVLLIVAGAVTGLFAALFLLLAIVFAMVLIMPIWAAMLLPGIALAVAASILIFAGVMRTRQRPPMLERTLASIKENVAWAQQHSK